ncbi:MAG: hypothetical protein KAS66_00315 [Candidatus Omnitrophica bacterium]|nr:hypothetical protein [Candidatus Omnitrophota bacterium]
MGKKKPVKVKVEFVRNYGGPEGLYQKGNTDTFDEDVATALCDAKHAKVYVAPPVDHAKLKAEADAKKKG